MKTLQLSYKAKLLPIQANELFRSWVIRNAFFLGMKPSQLSTIIFQNTDIWKSDIDIQLSQRSIRSLFDSVETSSKEIDRVFFSKTCSNFYPHLNKSKQIKWLLPVGVHSRANRYSLQFCPLCLAEDDNPFFRKDWRLAFMTSCHIHHVQLHDRCSNCLSSVDLFRFEKKKSEIFNLLDYVYCAKCNFDLRNTKIQQPSKLEDKCNEDHLYLLNKGHGTVGNIEFTYSHLYFDGLKRLWSLILCSEHGKNFFEFVSKILDLDSSFIHKRNYVKAQSEPEHLEIELRRCGNIISSYLMSDWPKRFTEICDHTGITRHNIFSPHLKYPYWFEKILDTELNKSTYVLTKKEIQNLKLLYQNKFGSQITESHQFQRFLRSLVP